MGEMAAVVGWYGPYNGIADANAAAKKCYSDGIYVVFGYKDFPGRGRPRLLYIGSGALSSRMIADHHAIGTGRVAKITSIWLGEIMSHKRPGPREKKVEPLIDAVESAMIAVLAPVINVRKKKFPKTSFAILNRWYSSSDYETIADRPSASWPDIIECEGPKSPAHLCWLPDGKVRRIARPTTGP